MNCNCITDLEGKMKEHLQPQVKAPITSVTCSGIAFVLAEKAYTSLTIPFLVKADAPGYRSEKGKAFPVHVSFCPFCGVSTKPNQAAA